MEPEKVAYRKTEWFDEARGLIQRSERGSEDELDWIENQIRSGHMLLYRVHDSNGLIGIFTARAEVLYNGTKDLLIHHAVSVQQQEKPFIVTLYPIIQDLAKQSGFNHWRVHATRPGMAKRLLQHGFKFQETIFYCEVV